MGPYDPLRHHRRSIRLQGYNYTQPGAYFITICAYERASLFGVVKDGKMELNAWGEIVREEWFKTAQIRPYVRLYEDEFVVMPNHVHGIIWIVNDAALENNNADDATIGDGDGDDATIGDGDIVVGARRRRAPTPHHAPTSDIVRTRRRRAPTPHHAPTSDIVRTRRRRAPTSHRAPTTHIERFGAPVPGSIPTIVRAFKSAVTYRINALRGTHGEPVWQRNYYEHIIRDERALNAIRQYIIENPLRWHMDKHNQKRTGEGKQVREIRPHFWEDKP